jgi:hypothetical protein
MLLLLDALDAIDVMLSSSLFAFAFASMSSSLVVLALATPW